MAGVDKKRTGGGMRWGKPWLPVLGVLVAGGVQAAQPLFQAPALSAQAAGGNGEQVVVFDAVEVAAQQPGERFWFRAPGSGREYELSFERSEHSAAGSLVLVGRVIDAGEEHSAPAASATARAQGRDAAQRQVVISSNGGYSHGRLQTADGEFILYSDASGTRLIEMAYSDWQLPPETAWCEPALPEAGAGADDGRDAGVGAGIEAGDQQSAGLAPAATGEAVALPANEALTTVDVLVAYNRSMREQYGGTAGVNARLDYLLALSNQAFIDSEAALQYRIVGRIEVEHSNSIRNGDSLDTISTSSSALGSRLNSERNALGADLVVLIRPYEMTHHGNCGIAWLGGYRGSAFQARYGFASVSDGESIDGSRWYCDDTTFAHELGHTMGLSHDWDQGDAGDGAFPHANGHGISGVFGTIMSYHSPTLARYSNPRQRCNGHLCGVAANQPRPADAVLALQSTRHEVSAFRATLVVSNLPPEVDAGSDFSVLAGSRTFLNGRANDSDGRVVAVQWRQLSGPQVILDDASILQPRFIAPSVAATLVFELMVTDDSGAQARALVRVSVLTPPAPDEPLASNGDFVRQQYLDLLQRSPGNAELSYWRGELDSGRLSRAGLIELFITTDEFRVPLANVVRLYRAYFRRVPDYPGLQYWLDELGSGQLRMADVATAFAQATEFSRTYGALNDRGFIELVYRNVLGRAPDEDGFVYWQQEMERGMRRGELMLSFSDAREYIRLSESANVVIMLHVALLKAVPAEAEFNRWRAALDAGSSSLGSLINELLDSAAYRARF